jgi:F-type H+-transporting ATPase subunit gamma
VANRRVLVKRRKAVRNIRKITRTMQLIATARFQAAFNRAVAARPYTEKLRELVADIGRALPSESGVAHPLLEARPQARRDALLVITSQRGLCGGYNSNVLRAAVAHLERQEAAGVPTDVHMVGKKGIAYFRFVHRPLAAQTTDVSDRPRFEQIEPLANALMASFLGGEVASVHVASMRFFSASRQRPEVIQLLPLSPAAPAAAPAQKAARREALYEFHPDPATLLAELLPAVVRVRLYQAFIDAAVSEQIARMVAMKAATEASEDMIRALTLKYNRARQSAITMELLDIVGGANALA